MEYKSFQFEVKAVDEKEGIVEGYASVFNNEDAHGDIVAPGAFAKTILERKGRIKVLWQHDIHMPIGKPLEMSEDSAGLFTRSKISRTPEGLRALTLIEDGVVSEMSIGFTPIKVEKLDDKGYRRRITEVKLYEYSPVTFAANELAQITGVKSADEFYDLVQKAKSMADAIGDIKAGRVLSEKNRSLVKDAVASLSSTSELLQALLEAAEPDSKSTHGSGAAADKAGEPDPLHSLIASTRALYTRMTEAA